MSTTDEILNLLRFRAVPPSAGDEGQGQPRSGNQESGEPSPGTSGHPNPNQENQVGGKFSRPVTWHPTTETLINFITPSFWERKQAEEMQGQGQLDSGIQRRPPRCQRSLFTANSSSILPSPYQRHQRNFPRPRPRPETNCGEARQTVSASGSTFALTPQLSPPPRNILTPLASLMSPGRATPPPKPTFFNSRGDIVGDSVLGALVSSEGLISIRLHQGVTVDITLNKAIRLQNNPASVIVALSADGATSALVHPSGRMYQYGSRVEISTMDHNGSMKFAKMSHRGISFTGGTAALIYVVDAAGTRSTSDIYSDMFGDFTVPVFRMGAIVGPEFVEQAMAVLRQGQYWLTNDGIENWLFNGIRVSQTADGLVRVNRTASKYQFRSSPLNGTVNLATPYVHCTASVGDACHLFVKRGERRLHFDGVSFIVRNAGHSAGYDENNQLKVY